MLWLSDAKKQIDAKTPVQQYIKLRQKYNQDLVQLLPEQQSIIQNMSIGKINTPLAANTAETPSKSFVDILFIKYPNKAVKKQIPKKYRII